MPTVNVFSDLLFKELERTFTEEEFEELCFDFGIELEEVTCEQIMSIKNEGKLDKAKGLSERPIYRIDIPANRYDMLCLEGISMALKSYLGISPPPIFKTVGSKLEKMVVFTEVSFHLLFRLGKLDHLLWLPS
jgi:phenylalanyl-tRNA synthetase beta chain